MKQFFFAIVLLFCGREEIASQNILAPDDPIAAMLDSLGTKKILDKIYTRASDQKSKFHFAADSIPVCDEFVFENRLAKLDAASPFDLQYNANVKPYIELYVMRKRQMLSKILGLSQLYYPVFEEILDRFNLPLELKHLAVIESALNPLARSRAGATGLWQFMYPTAKILDLSISSYIDERSDPYKATVAACKYLQELYTMFGDWQMVLAAYNAGPGTINHAIRRSGGKKTYWEIRPYLPLETQGYVPAFIAANYAMTYYPEHNIIPAIPQKSYFELDTIILKEPMTFMQISQILEVPLEEVQYYNPVYKKQVIPSGGNILTLPRKSVGKFITNENEIYAMLHKQAEEQQLVTTSALKEVQISHIVKKGEYLSSIARKYGVSVADLKTWNLIGRYGLKPGRKLVLYKVVRNSTPMAQTNGNTARDSAKQENKQPLTKENQKHADQNITGRPHAYTIKRGDTLYKIALDFSIPLEELLGINNLKKETALFVGQKIKLTP